MDRSCTSPPLLKYRLLAIILLWWACALVAWARSADPEVPAAQFQLIREERAWLDAHHTVRVRIVDWPPYMITTPAPSGTAGCSRQDRRRVARVAAH